MPTVDFVSQNLLRQIFHFIVKDYPCNKKYLQKWFYNIHSQTNILGKGMNPYPPSYGLKASLFFFYEDGLILNNPRRFKPNQTN